jgi:nucleoside-diphosphate-sugar epimerase
MTVVCPLFSLTMPFQPDREDLALPPGSLILVTGATGFIATHIVNEALKAGYRVRGTARSAEKAQDDEVFHNNQNYHCVVVADLSAAEAFNDAVKDCAGVIHTASPTDMQSDPYKVIPSLVAGIESILESCMKEPKVKRFVYTSSSTAACLPIPGRKLHLDRSSWNDEAVKSAWEEPHAKEKAYTVYAASKTEAERAMWKFSKEREPAFVVNSILPDTNFGRILNNRRGPTGKAIMGLYEKSNVPSYIPSRKSKHSELLAKSPFSFFLWAKHLH